MIMSETTSKKDMRPSLVIIGAGGHAVSVANVALSAGYKVTHFVDPNKIGIRLLDIPIIGDIAELDPSSSYSIAIAVGDNAARERIYRALIGQHIGLHFPALVHPTAVVSFFTTIGQGCVVMPGAVIGPNTQIGEFCLLNTRSLIDHDGVMQDFSSLAPAAVIGGTVIIGRRTAISIGAIVKHGLKIGDDCVIGANSYQNRDLTNNQIAYGTPAKQIRQRNIGDIYLK
jgi:sugar O-acyltransferase (sialic acid O-acetyltransferase NeuD family)